jgi:3-keto steroid reductase
LSANRWRGQEDVTKESREEFEVLGQRVWREMEHLRQTWEKRLQG